MTGSFSYSFELVLSVPSEDLRMTLRAMGQAPWLEFYLNPRRLRGSDFLMRWSQGVWSEERLMEAVNATGRYFALPYGPSGTAPQDDVRAFELYFERLEKAGLGDNKRPDLLIFRAEDSQAIKGVVEEIGGVQELPFMPESDKPMRTLLSRALLAVECENSLWRATQMPDYGKPLSAQKRLRGKLGLSKSAVVPTVIVKEEDRSPLQRWHSVTKVPVHIWHAFYDEAYGISLFDAEQLIESGAIEPIHQTFQAPGGATTRKVIYKIYYHYTYKLATTVEEPQLVADSIVDKNGHILPYVRFVGGRSRLTEEAIGVIDAIAAQR